jgi:hypothetical protein
MVLTMKSVAIPSPGTDPVDIVFGEYEKVVGAKATPAGASATAVATVVTVSGITVTITPADDAGEGDYYVLADCI